MTGIAAGLALAALVWTPAIAAAQIVQRQGVPAELKNKIPQPPPTNVEPNYTIGPEDVLVITVWNEPEVSGETIVRPDGKITLKYGNDIIAAGQTTEGLKEKIIAELKREYEDPTVFIVVKAINSRRVYITGAISRPGAYALNGPMNVLQLISTAGGLQPFAKQKSIMLISATQKGRDGQPLTIKINYADLMKGKNTARNNPLLQPGDQLIVPGGD
jgi:polysaccharide export outer membrane protein